MSTNDEKSVPNKDNARDNRLSFRNFAEHQMRREFKDMVLEQKCNEHLKEFAKCAEQEGLMVIIKCRHLNRALTDCMKVHNSNEAWEKYKAEHKEELEKRTIKS
jgi:hypothetical protein